MPSVLFVCLGNICRSPMAEGILRREIERRGLVGWRVDSAGTGAHHAGEEADPRTLAVLEHHDADFDHTARQIKRSDFDAFDLLLAMDRTNYRDLLRIAPPERESKVHMMLEPTTGGEVPDPWFGGGEGFVQVYALLDDAVNAWIDKLVATAG